MYVGTLGTQDGGIVKDLDKGREIKIICNQIQRIVKVNVGEIRYKRTSGFPKHLDF